MILEVRHWFLALAHGVASHVNSSTLSRGFRARIRLALQVLACSSIQQQGAMPAEEDSPSLNTGGGFTPSSAGTRHLEEETFLLLQLRVCVTINARDHLSDHVMSFATLILLLASPRAASPAAR